MAQKFFDFFRAHLFAITTCVPSLISIVFWVVFYGFDNWIGFIAIGLLAWIISAYSIYQIFWKILNSARSRSGGKIEKGSMV